MGAKVRTLSHEGSSQRALRGLIEMTGAFRAVLAVSVLALLLGGCGVKGSLETPRAQADNTAEAQSGQGKPEGGAPKGHKGFVLDGLLR